MDTTKRQAAIRYTHSQASSSGWKEPTTAERGGKALLVLRNDHQRHRSTVVTCIRRDN